MVETDIKLNNYKSYDYSRVLWVVAGFVLILWSLRITDYSSTLSWINGIAVLTIATGLFLIFISGLSISNDDKLLKRIGAIALIVSLLVMCVWSFVQVYQVPGYGTDELAFDQYAGYLAVHFHNPYLASMLPSFKMYNVAPNSYTFLLNGGVVSRLSYPALAFELYVPLIWLGVNLQGAVILNVFAWVVVIVMLYLMLPQKLKALSIIVGSFSVYVGYAVGGVTDALFLPFLLIAAYRWDSYGRDSKRSILNYASPVGLGLAMAVKQNAWLILPLIMLAFFIEDRTRYDRLKEQSKRLLSYFLIATITFILPNLIFIVDNPARWIEGIFQPVIARAVPAGQGIVGLSLYLNLGGGSLTLYTVLEILSVIFILVGFFIAYGRVKPLLFFLPSFVFFFASRSFGSYFVTLLPALLISMVTVESFKETSKRRNLVVIFTTMSLVLLGLFGIAILIGSPLQLTILSVHTTGELQTVDEVTIQVTNNTSHTINPAYTVQENGTVTAFWNVTNSSKSIPSHGTRGVILQAPNFYAMPPIVGGFQVVAYTTSPATVSASSIFIAQQDHLKISPDAINGPLPLNQTVPIQIQLVNQYDQPVNAGGIIVYFSQTIYGQNGLLPGDAIIYSYTDNAINRYQGASPVTALTNPHGQAEFFIIGKHIDRDPVFFEANLVNTSKNYPYGYSEILALRFKSG